MSTAKPAAWKGVFNTVRMTTFVVIEVLAALALDGWLSIAMWVVAGWTALAFTVMYVAMLDLAAKQAVSEQSGSQS